MRQANEAAIESDRGFQVIHERASNEIHRRTLPIPVIETGISEAFDRVRDAMRGTMTMEQIQRSDSTDDPRCHPDPGECQSGPPPGDVDGGPSLAFSRTPASQDSPMPAPTSEGQKKTTEKLRYGDPHWLPDGRSYSDLQRRGPMNTTYGIIKRYPLPPPALPDPTLSLPNVPNRGDVYRLVLGDLPKSMKRVTEMGRKYRRMLEAVVLHEKGQVSLTDAHLIDEATQAELHAAVCRWIMNRRYNDMSVKDLRECSSQIVKAKTARNQAVAALQLERDRSELIIEALYTVPGREEGNDHESP